MDQIVLGLALFILSAYIRPTTVAVTDHVQIFTSETILARQQLDLTDRVPDSYANEVFSDNIILSLHYLKNDAGPLPLDWNSIRQPFTVTFKLNPQETFVFHNNVLPEFQNPAVSMNTRYYTEEGYKSVWGLGGNGVCHLASLINWVARDAHLTTVTKVNHDFAPVPGVPREYGVAIMSQIPDQNLYITNNQNFPVTFIFTNTNKLIDLRILKNNE